MRHSVRFVFLAVLVLAGTAQAQDSGLAFLRVGPDASGLALGDAGVALGPGPWAAERNPAGLALGAGSEFGLTHHQWIGDMKTYGLSGRFASGSRGGVGLYVRASGSGDLQARDQPGPASGTFDAQFVAVGAAYGVHLGPLRLGMAGKYLSERIYSVSANGFAVDFGAQASLLGDAVHLGATLANVGSMQELADRSTELPRTLRAGVAVQPFRVLSFDDGSTLLDAVFTLEVSHNTVDSESHVHLGLAANVFETVRVSGGYVSNDALRDFSAGIGVRAGALTLDYAILPFEAGFGGPGHIFTLLYQAGR